MNRFLCIILLLVFGSCAKDDDVDRIFPDKINRFELIAWEIDTPIDMNGDGISSSNLVDEFSCLTHRKLEFISAGRGFSYSTGFPVFGEFLNIFNETGTSVFVSCQPQASSVDSFGWSFEGDDLLLEGEEITARATLIGDDLEFTIENHFTFNKVIDNQEERILTEDVTFRYVRVKAE
jgi:hypothetical protein